MLELEAVEGKRQEVVVGNVLVAEATREAVVGNVRVVEATRLAAVVRKLVVAAVVTELEAEGT